jgi:5-(carboxyamino)imidazole ribonucleotide mutase
MAKAQERRVGILVGSKSDLPLIKGTCDVLDRLGISYELVVRSAHRTPEETIDFASKARACGFKVLICGAGMAAHLAGIVAAHTTLPVIGIPIAAGPLGGRDALYATVQMPPGTPVATVAIDGAQNAAWLAAQILALEDADLERKITSAREARRQEILAVRIV